MSTIYVVCFSLTVFTSQSYLQVHVYNGKVAMLATSNAQLCQFFAISRMIAKLTFNKLDDVLMSIGTEFLHDLDFSLQAFLDTLVLQIALLEDFERNL